MKKVFWSKIACVLVLIFSLFALTACQFLPGGDDDVIQLSTPLNLRYDNGTLKWSIVDNASGYVICVDQDEMQVQTNSFALSQLELADGEHTAKVKASGGQGFTSSAYSSSITFTYKNVNDDSGDSDDDSNQLSTPENLRYDNGTLKWSIVDNASGYVICVDQDEMQVQTNSFALSQLELADGEHTAKVKAYGGQGFTSSAYSTLITFNYENVNDDNSDSLSAITQAAFEQRYIARPTAISEKSAERYEVGGLYYTLVDMGYIDKVPLQDNVEYVHFEGVNEETVTISTSESSEESIAKKVEESISETDGWSSSVNLEAEGDFGVVKFLQSLKVKVSVGHEQNGSDTTTNTTSIENASSFTKNKSRQSTMTFVPGKNKVGYYRYILTGSVHVFAYIAYDPAVQQYVFAETYSVIDHCGWRWEYSQDGSFAYDEYGKLDLADSYLDLAKTKPAETREFIVDNIVDFKYKLLDNEDNITIKDSGYCGLKNSGRETIDLSAYSKFFTKEYVFCFDVCVNLCEVNDGIQEIYLYSKDNVATGKEIELSQARQEYGLVCGTMITHTSGKADKTPKDHYDTWYVRGDQVKDIMYITYDASGNDEDDWKRISTRIDLTICKSNIEPIYNTKFIDAEVLSINKSSTIIDKGVYGMDTSNDRNEIDLSKYEDYFTNEFLFTFDIVINISEKDNGYQEVYLYNTKNSGSNSLDISWTKAKNDYGLITGAIIEHGIGYKNTSVGEYVVRLTCTGDQLLKKAKADENVVQDYMIQLRYDATGDGEDTWYRDSVNVFLTVTQVPVSQTDSETDDVHVRF